MSSKDRRLLVLSLVSGRNFVDKPEASVIAEAKLDRELLSTDPVPQSPTPRFEQELAWEVDRAGLRQYRLQRASIKLQIFTINYDASPCSRNLLGYIILDVRSATERKTFKWFQLLNSKLRPCPEIYCGLYIDLCSPSNPEVSGDLDATPLEVGRFVESFENHLVSGFEISGTGSTKGCYLISTVLVSIPQLTKLLPPEVSQSSTFKLALRFLNNDLFIWEFKEEDCTKLVADQCKFFIRATLDAIRSCFSRVNIIEITLCADEKPIGHCQGNLSLIGDQITSTTRYPLCVDVTFTLISPEFGHDNSPVILRFNVTKYDVQPSANEPDPQLKESPKANYGCSSDQALDLDTALAQTQTNPESTSEILLSQQPVTSRTTAPQIPTNYMNKSVQLRRFCYTIELKTIRACCEPSPPKEIYVYAKYVYPLFGTTNPIMTLPPVQFSMNEEKHFSQGYCAFELAADFSEFKSRLLEEPLNVEILGRSSDGSSSLESSLGWAIIPLGEIFPEPVIEMSNSRRRFMTGVADVKLNEKPMAHIKYSLVLDDFGVYNASTTAEITSLNQIEGGNTDATKMVPDDMTKLPGDIRQTPEYRAALELELWKAKEEERFKNDLKLREQKLLIVFAEEWKRREAERESLCKKKMQEYQMLEDKLRSVLEALVERERQLTLKEAALNAAQRDLERNIEIREKDLLNDVQRKIRDAEQAVSNEQQRNFQLNNELSALREKCNDLEERLIEQHLQATTVSTVGTNADTKDGLDQAKRDDEEIRRLQFELVRLTTELTNAQSQISTMERRLDSALRGRIRYKDLWTRALQEVTRLRQEAANATKQELQRREAEVEGLRREQCLLLRAGDTRTCPYYNTPAQQNSTDPQRLEGPTPGSSEGVPLPPSIAFQKANDPALDVQLRRLRDERECLLASGVYYEDDTLIVDLDKEIKRLQIAISNAV
ncbi:unnamed protein product [Taenia asiatica]|uniref:DUF3668 domain-containing protein n=1 Tax=Taenia asiatica TaxID=60517 RepID=A0A0R3WFT1_TAEAS|nr:unnamed protein product [Taenia asiatica]